jgi:hypothetical protein
MYMDCIVRCNAIHCIAFSSEDEPTDAGGERIVRGILS